MLAFTSGYLALGKSFSLSDSQFLYRRKRSFRVGVIGWWLQLMLGAGNRL